MADASSDPHRGLVLRPFRALRPTVDDDALGTRLCPPYDVIDGTQRARLMASDPANAVAVVLPETQDGSDPYEHAEQVLESWVADGLCSVDDESALYVYEMRDGGSTTRGLVGVVELRDPADGVILPHENTMAGPVADRLALMTATQANVEPIYLVYDGGGPASAAVAEVDADEPIASTTTPDGVAHRLWSITDPAVHAAVADDLAGRKALIADGHHRYATYRELQARTRPERGDGPWDFGLTLLVDSSSYGPQVHAIHRVLPHEPLDRLVDAARDAGLDASPVDDVAGALAAAAAADHFVCVLADAGAAVVVSDPDRKLSAAIRTADEPEALADLDVTVLHRGLVERVWDLTDTVDTVGYAHSIEEALANAAESGGTAVLLRATPVAAVAAVAAEGARMPRKSTLFTPKPASGLVMRRFADG